MERVSSSRSRSMMTMMQFSICALTVPYTLQYIESSIRCTVLLELCITVVEVLSISVSQLTNANHHHHQSPATSQSVPIVRNKLRSVPPLFHNILYYLHQLWTNERTQTATSCKEQHNEGSNQDQQPSSTNQVVPSCGPFTHVWPWHCVRSCSSATSRTLKLNQFEHQSHHRLMHKYNTFTFTFTFTTSTSVCDAPKKSSRQDVFVYEARKNGNAPLRLGSEHRLHQV
jgi:hypothetical protein